MNSIYFSIVNLNEKTRVDKFISDNLKLITRNQFQQRIKQIEINGKISKNSKKVFNKDNVKIFLHPQESIDVIPEKIDFDIIYEDENVCVINKPQGMVVHPAPGNPSGTLANGLLYHVQNLNKEYEESDFRPGIVHRLDKDTSGVIITAKNLKTHNYLSQQFLDKKTKKVYLSINKGHLNKKNGQIDTYIARSRKNRKIFTATESSGKHSITKLKLLSQRNNYSFTALYPITGRTHQLRVHMKHIEHPILGDPLYSRTNSKSPSLMLHAYKLYITLPNETEPKVFRAPLPIRFKDFLNSNFKD